MKFKPVGHCRICGQFGELSFEHVPPQSAFNNHMAFKRSLESFIETQSLSTPRGKKMPRGIGDYTLCKPCNSNTGGWYAEEYVEWCRRVYSVLTKLDEAASYACISLHDVKPRRFLKQVIVMMFSVNGLEFRDNHPDLVRFVQDPRAVGLSDRYDIRLSILRGPYRRMSGITAHLRGTDVVVLSEIASVPFASVLYVDSPQRGTLGSISWFARCGEAKRSVDLVLPIGSSHSPFPADYRTLSEMERDRIAQQESANADPSHR